MYDSSDELDSERSFVSRSKTYIREMERLRNEMNDLLRRRADLERRIREKVAELAESRARLLALRRIQERMARGESFCSCPRGYLCRCYSRRG